jgi:hypothetical protein
MGTTLAILAGLGLLIYFGSGSTPRAGIASAPDKLWTYVVREGDSPSSIALLVVGNDRRFLELIDANPELPTVGNRANPWSSGFNFASLGPGDILRLPAEWNTFIDQLGNFAGKAGPFPKG